MSDEHLFSLDHASAEYRNLAGKLRELARACVFLDPDEAYCGLQDRSIVELPTSTAGPHQRALCDWRDARMDTVGTSRALDNHNVFALA
jgi:hypothetical protein